MAKCTLFHPFRIRFGVEATRDDDYAATTRCADLVALVSATKDGPGRREFGHVSAVRCLPGEKAEIELCCEQGLSIEKEFGAVAAELEKHGWKVTGLR